MRPTFIPGPKGDLFTLYHPPQPDQKISGDVVFAPPFGEELNRSRHMVNRQARALADAGFGVLIPDLYGTGDSQGDFSQATWQGWCKDIVTVLQELERQGRTVAWLWGARLGALLMLDVIRSLKTPPPRLCLWQPVLDGRIYLNQILRVRIAGNFLAKNDNSETTPETSEMLRERLFSGETMAVGGYNLSSELAIAIDRLRALELAPPPEVKVTWLELSASAEPRVSVASAKVGEQWRTHGATVTMQAVPGPLFWNLQEPEFADELIDATTTALVNAQG